MLSEAAAPARKRPSDELELSIVMPCLNEVRTLETCIRKAHRSLEEHGVRGEIIVADNGSTDGSQRLARRLGARVVPIPERGYGAALAGGIAAARGRYVLMADSDDSYDLRTVQPFVEQLRQGHELVMGNRFRGGIAPGAMPLLHRYLGNPGLTLLARVLFGSPFGDVYCGQRAFTREAFHRLGLQAKGMEFALEMVVKATLFGLRTQEVPVTLSPDGRDRAPHLRTWRDGWRSLRLFLQHSPRWLLVYPGLVLLLAGLGAGGWLLSAGATGAALGLGLLASGGAVAAGFQGLLLGAVGALALPRPQGAPPRPVFGRSLEVGLALAAALTVGSGGALIAGADTTAAHLVAPAVLLMSLAGQAAVTGLFLHVLRPRLLDPQGPTVEPSAAAARPPARIPTAAGEPSRTASRAA